jgi:F-box protein, helicase, 18
MQLTPEQKAIIGSSGNIKINAVAGSGKTTTVIEYAKTRPANSKILYLAFNKSVKLEAIKKFANTGLINVDVETAHSLAYRHIIPRGNFNIRAHGYKTHEIAELLNLEGNEEKHTKFIIANHINKLVAYFCNSDKQKVQDLNYLDTISDPKAKSFVQSFYDYIVTQARLLLGKMNSGLVEITHDFYLKKFQLSNPQLHYDYILFDEGQDASPAMLDVFLNQNATKVIVGDTHQQIYGWRHAVNSLQKIDFATFHLSTSFRFSQDIAKLAMNVLNLKDYIKPEKSIPIIGKGASIAIKTKAILARTNLGLLLKAIEYVNEKKNVKHIYFEGNIHSYTYADEGASLYDILNLYNRKHHLIRDKLIKGMKDIVELEDYIKKAEDAQLGMMVEIVNEYGNDIPDLLNAIKAKHVSNDEKEKAEVIFSTVHRCKGMEYDSVQLVNDFITELKIEKLCNDPKAKEVQGAKLNEEINLLYVAITRTKNSLYIPDVLLPSGFINSPQVHVLKTVVEEENVLPSKNKIYQRQFTNSNTAAFQGRNLVPIESYKPWTKELDSELAKMFREGLLIKDIAKHFGRTISSVASRIKKLELHENYTS